MTYILEIHKLFDKEANREAIAKQFEDVVDAMVNELYFENSIREANASVLELVKQEIPEMSVKAGKEERRNLIQTTYKKLITSKSEIRNRIIKQNISVQEVKLINQNLNLKASGYSENIDSEF